MKDSEQFKAEAEIALADLAQQPFLEELLEWMVAYIEREEAAPFAFSLHPTTRHYLDLLHYIADIQNAPDPKNKKAIAAYFQERSQAAEARLLFEVNGMQADHDERKRKK